MVGAHACNIGLSTLRIIWCTSTLYVFSVLVLFAKIVNCFVLLLLIVVSGTSKYHQRLVNL